MGGLSKYANSLHQQLNRQLIQSVALPPNCMLQSSHERTKPPLSGGASDSDNSTCLPPSSTSKRPRPESTISSVPSLPTFSAVVATVSQDDIDVEYIDSPAKRSRRRSVSEIDIGSIHLFSQSAPASPTSRTRTKPLGQRSSTVIPSSSTSSPSVAMMGKRPASRERTPRPKPYVCHHEGCNMSYAKPCKLEEHLRIHTGERPFKCTFQGCTSAFRRSTNLAVHLKSHNNQRDAVCPVVECGKAFYSNHKLKRHLLSHDVIDIPLKGEIIDGCPLSAEQIQETVQHNQELRPLECHWEGCGRRFAKRQQLNTHVSMDHKGTKPYVCEHEGCHKDFMTPSKLRKHQLTHNQDRRYECGYPDCSAIFNKWSLLQKHITEIHKKIPCPVCGQPFLRKNMVTHVQTHSSVKIQYPCPYHDCAKGFSSKSNLKKHIETAHEKSKVFKCIFEKCGKVFQFKHVLQKHTEAVHLSPLKKNRKKRSDAIVTTELEDLIGLSEERYRELRPIACAVSTCARRFTTWRLMERHLLSKAHDEDMLWTELPQEILLKELESLNVAEEQGAPSVEKGEEDEHEKEKAMAEDQGQEETIAAK